MEKCTENIISSLRINPKTFWHKSRQGLFLHPIQKFPKGFPGKDVRLTHGVMVALQILVLSVKVRILMGQRYTASD